MLTIHEVIGNSYPANPMILKQLMYSIIINLHLKRKKLYVIIPVAKNLRARRSAAGMLSLILVLDFSISGVTFFNKYSNDAVFIFINLL